MKYWNFVFLNSDIFLMVDEMLHYFIIILLLFVILLSYIVLCSGL